MSVDLSDVDLRILFARIAADVVAGVITSDPWLIAKGLILPNGDLVDSKDELLKFSFVLEETDEESFPHLFYQATARPGGWTRVYDEPSDSMFILDEKGERRMEQYYTLARGGYAHIVLYDWPPQKEEIPHG